MKREEEILINMVERVKEEKREYEFRAISADIRLRSAEEALRQLREKSLSPSAPVPNEKE